MAGLIKKIFRRDEVDCTEVRRRSSDYLDGDLPPQKLSKIRFHLDNCGPCRAFVNTLSSTIGVLSRLPRVSAPPSFEQALDEKIKKANQEKTKKSDQDRPR